MKKPEKKEEKPFKVLQKIYGEYFETEINLERIHNQACDDWEKYHLDMLEEQEETYAKAHIKLYEENQSLRLSEEEVERVIANKGGVVEIDGTCHFHTTPRILAKAIITLQGEKE